MAGRLNSLLRKLAGFKETVQKGSDYDKRNVADDVRERSPLVKSVVNRTARIFIKDTIGEDVTVLPEEYDVNQPSTLAIQELVFTSVAKNPAANLLSIEIVADSAESIEVEEHKITINTDDGVSDSDSIKALVDADSQASALVTVAVNSGEGATLVDAEDLAFMSGAIG